MDKKELSFSLTLGWNYVNHVCTQANGQFLPFPWRQEGFTL